LNELSTAPKKACYELKFKPQEEDTKPHTSSYNILNTRCNVQKRLFEKCVNLNVLVYQII